MAIHVNVDNFVRAETDRMFGDLSAVAGGTNRWFHSRQPTPIEAQTVIRMNRDTLYSLAIVEMSGPVEVVVPDAGGRYLSVMVVDRDHHINEIIHSPGTHELSPDLHRTEFIAVGARLLVDPSDPDDLAAVNSLQDALELRAGDPGSFPMPEYDAESMDTTRKALLRLAAGIDGFDRTFGAVGNVDPVRHLIGTAAGWGGLPESEAYYLNCDPGLAVGDYELRVADVPVDAFWSISMYDRDGHFAANDLGAYSVNDITAVKDADGAVTVRFGGGEPTGDNFLPINEGWNYVVRLYRPRAEVLDGTWSFPTPVRLTSS